ncbi:hypothetical protein V5F38_07255 [Xanthobacter sp. V0B-10]|uniref:hypothetical protein n=1 Tax=Xanthobacter albus TaxID=3119929 RepID=UPI00372C854A
MNVYIADVAKCLFVHSGKWAFEERQKIGAGATFFLHIPKSAGTAFNSALAAALNASSIVSGFDHCVFGSFSEFATIQPDIRASIYAPSEPLPKEVDFIGGHFALSTVRRYYPNANTCVVLREPISRILSHWLYWRQFSDDELTGWGPAWSRRVLRARGALVDFLRDPEIACQIDNVATRMVLWPDVRVPDGAFIERRNDQAILLDVEAEVRRFDFIDYLENPDFVANVEKWIGVPFVLPRMNETRPACELFPVDLDRELTPEAFALLEERSRLDQSLWQTVAVRRGAGDTARLKQELIRDFLRRQNRIQARRGR